MRAGLLLAARTHLARLGLPCPKAMEILRATGARATRAYVRRAELDDILRSRARAPGRPRATPAARADAALSTARIAGEVLGFVMDHPGAVHGRPDRRRYSEGFRAFIRELRGRFPGVDDTAFARAARVPLPSLRAWLRQPRTPVPTPLRSSEATEQTGASATVIRAWMQWEGSFTGFCEHVQRDLGIPWRRGVLERLLHECGLRSPSRRRGRPRDAHAPRGSFRTFFPGAQWVADGTRITVHLDERPYTFNLQLTVDACSGAVIGISVRDHEDGQAVLESFDAALATTGEPPLALLLDNRPCNHSARVVDNLSGRTTLVYAARGRPQSKGHVEGAFGLLSQNLPPLRFEGGAPRALARQILDLVVQCWARMLNHRPRRDRGGRSRAELYEDHRESRQHDPRAAAEQRAVVRAAIARRVTRQARRYPQRDRQSALQRFLADELARLAIPDSRGSLAAALAAHPVHVVLAGLATYAGKRRAGTLPVDADGRYLLGIVGRLSEREEGMHIAEALWRVRTCAQAHLQAVIEQRCEAARQAAVGRPGHVDGDGAAGTLAVDIQAMDILVDEAMAQDSPVERHVDLVAAARTIARVPSAQHSEMFRRAARSIHACARLPYRGRLDAVHVLAAALVPVP